jgi:NDP-4-keto-2,6-dideoxyhexose 3-C-methyltransferase
LKIVKCRACGSGKLVQTIELGEQYLSDFRSDLSKPEKFPLTMLLCEECSLSQLSVTVNRDLMYHDGYGYRSGINEQIKSNLQMLVGLALNYVPNPSSWLDIAANDGTLLSMVPKSVKRVGVDPVKKFNSESIQHADEIVSDFYPAPSLKDLNFDVITSISMFYDLDNPNDFVSSIARNLSKSGVWVVQQNYVLSMIENTSFDNICHEHIEYYSLTAMNKLVEKFNLEINEFKSDPINGGSFITVISHKGARPISGSVGIQLKVEDDFGISNPKSYIHFEQRVTEVSNDLLAILDTAKENKKSVYIYGASTRGAVIWQRVGITDQHVKFAVERQKEKIGKFFSAVGIPIISEEEMRENPPDYLLVGPWFLKESFLKRESEYLTHGGCMIFPLPNVEQIRG